MGSNNPNPFKYPKSRHVRRLSPGPFTDPSKYKPALAEEFHHSCVYCSLPDAFGGNFEVEHYRPQKKFEKLRTEYSNLFYSCRACNGRKGQQWFEPVDGGQYIVNPCQDIMTDHLWFHRHQVRARSKAGELTEEVFQLNDKATIEHRQNIEQLIADCWFRLKEFRKKLKKVEKKLNHEKDQNTFNTIATVHEKLKKDIQEREKVLRKIFGCNSFVGI